MKILEKDLIKIVRAKKYLPRRKIRLIKKAIKKIEISGTLSVRQSDEFPYLYIVLVGDTPITIF